MRNGLTLFVVKTKRLLHESIRPLPAVVGLLRVFKPHERGLMGLPFYYELTLWRFGLLSIRRFPDGFRLQRQCPAYQLVSVFLVPPAHLT
jgi:hypothetical protein